MTIEGNFPEHNPNPEHKEFVMPPSEDAAWLLGVLSAAGNVETKRGTITLQSRHQELVDKFNRLGERIFDLPSHLYILPSKSQTPEYFLASFHSKEKSSEIGNFDKNTWPTTLGNKYKWLYENPIYLHQFLAGFFDARGSVNKLQKEADDFWIHLSHKSNEGIVELLNLLQIVGIRNAVVKNESGNKESVIGIGIYQRSEVERFAQIVESCIPHKKERLKYCRSISENLELSSRKPPEPSPNLAWLLGVISIKGSASEERVSFISKHPEFVDKVRKTAQDLFNLPAYPYYQGIRFGNRPVLKFIGNLKRSDWPETIRTKHGWIYEGEEFIWQFLSGVFDSCGWVENYLNTRDPRIRIVIGSKIREEAEELSLILSMVGITNIRIQKIGISISDIEDIKRFAGNIQSCVAEKQQDIEFCTYLQKQRITGSKNPNEYQQRLQAYKTVMRLRAETGWGARRLVKHPDLAEYKLTFNTIQGWIYKGYDPERDNWHKKTVYSSRESNPPNVDNNDSSDI